MLEVGDLVWNGTKGIYAIVADLSDSGGLKTPYAAPHVCRIWAIEDGKLKKSIYLSRRLLEKVC